MTGIPVTIVNHVAIDIEAAPDAVWRVILDEYVEASKFRKAGYSIEPLDGSESVFGGYRMRLEENGTAVEERVVRITERDETAHRLSVFADYVVDPDGPMRVHATYHARESERGTQYTLDCHADIALDASANVAASVEEWTKQAEVGLLQYLGTIKAAIEGALA
ncbi:SRPBCC family protein [Amycolatopsis thailandensis]|uniref:hypothetical protein n=1 Tax=Amycolatopsis thailandensis TaxID=589330 RepID=UPI003625C9CB